MAATIVAANSAGAQANSVTCSKPAGTASGDVLVAFHTSDWGTYAGMTAPAGWTLVTGLDRGSNNLHLKLYSKTAGGSEPASYTFNQSGTPDGCVSIIALRDVTETGLVFVTPVWQAAGSTSRTAPSLTGAPTDGVLLCCAMVEPQNSSNTFTPPAGMTEQTDLQSTTWNSHSVAALLSPPATTGVRTFTSTNDGSGQVGGIGAAIAVPAATPAGTTYSKTGGATGAGAGSGAKTRTSATVVTKTGAAAAPGTGSGAKVRTPAATISKTGAAAATGTGSGAATRTPAATHPKTGAAASTGAASGASARSTATTHVATGGAAATGTGSGTEVVEPAGSPTRTGGAAATGAASGARGLDTAHSGGGLATGAASGAAVVTSPAGVVKTGAAAGTAAGSGARVVQPATVHTRTGGAASPGVAGGAAQLGSPAAHVRTGGGAAPCLAAGTKVVIPAAAAAPRVHTPTRVTVLDRHGAVLVTERAGQARLQDRSGSVAGDTEGRVRMADAYGVVLET